MFVTKDTEEATNKKFAIRDISRRAKVAYDQNVRLFNSPEHKATIEYVKNTMEGMFADVDAIFETARPATKRSPAHTEVKFNKVTLYKRERHLELKGEVVEKLGQLNIDLIYKPKTNSYSVKVF